MSLKNWMLPALSQVVYQVGNDSYMLPPFLSFVLGCLHPDHKMGNFIHKNLDNFNCANLNSIFAFKNETSLDYATPKKKTVYFSSHQ